jgi:histidinol-phosphatase
MTETYMQAVAEVAKLAGDFALSYYKKGITVETKQDGSPVTQADRGAEQLARTWIEQRFPQDGIFGEEFGRSRPDAPRQWIIDPIDGTKSFVRSVPLWGTLVAVTEGDHVLAGCIYCPPTNELLVAATGRGCYLDGARCTVSHVSSLSEATVLVTDARFPAHPSRRTPWSTLAERANIARTWGDCYGYILLATGRADVMIDDAASPWDAAALYPIITEAGGIMTDWQGRRTPFGGDVIATNLALAEQVRSILTESV